MQRRDAEDAEKNAEKKHTNMVFSSDLGALGASAFAFGFGEGFRFAVGTLAKRHARRYADTPRGGVIILGRAIA